MNDKPDTVTIAGVPPLRWERGIGWSCKADLPAWTGLARSRLRVSFDCPDVYARTPPSSAQAAAFAWLVADGGEARDATLLAAYNDLRQLVGDYPEYVDSIANVLGRPLGGSADLPQLVKLNDVGISHAEKNGHAMVTLEFAWVWEDDHEAFVAVWAGGRLNYIGPR